MNYRTLRVPIREDYSPALIEFCNMFNSASPYSKQEFVESYGWPARVYSVREPKEPKEPREP